jgi:clan AA aspartic protease (TIGR02281 family)
LIPIFKGIGIMSYSFVTCNDAVFSVRREIKVEETLSQKLVQTAQDAATNWTKGRIEKMLSPPLPPSQINADEAGSPDTKSKMPPKVAIASPAEEPSPKLTGPAVSEVIVDPEGARNGGEARSMRPSAERMIAVPMTPEGGTYVVPVVINNALTLNFVLDSGAAAADVFSTLARTGSVTTTDITGKQTYVLADGSKTQLPTFIIRSLKVGDRVVENVRASVASSSGSLLLGQSFLERFRSWSIDNTKHELRLEPH